jgi:hypothetical protein
MEKEQNDELLWTIESRGESDAGGGAGNDSGIQIAIWDRLIRVHRRDAIDGSRTGDEEHVPFRRPRFKERSRWQRRSLPGDRSDPEKSLVGQRRALPSHASIKI